MIYVRVELWRGGDPHRRVLLGEARISNVSRLGRQATRGHYLVELTDKAGRNWRACSIKDFPRKRLLAWDLLYRALRQAVGGRNP